MAGQMENKYRVLPPLLKKTAADSRRWKIGDFLTEGKSVSISFLNAHAVNIAVENDNFRDFLMASDYLLRDGIGLKIALLAFHLGETENLNGTDLIPRIIGQYKDRRIAIWGASGVALAACRARLEKEGFTNIVSTLHGFLEDDVYVQQCAQVKPEIVILCMGMPRQELLARRLAGGQYAGLVICGGGWVDFYSGTKPRAPLWVRCLSAEWIYRLIKEPKRLGKRYTIDVIRFFYALAQAKSCMRT